MKIEAHKSTQFGPHQRQLNIDTDEDHLSEGCTNTVIGNRCIPKFGHFQWLFWLVGKTKTKILLLAQRMYFVQNNDSLILYKIQSLLIALFCYAFGTH